MKRELALAVGIILLLGLFLGVLHLHDTQPDYSYNAYHASHHITLPPCTLDGSKKRLDGVVLCAETGRLPDNAQINAWEGFVLWDACEQYGDTYACAQLGD